MSNRTDHDRGCAGRTYTCTCGYDDEVERELAEVREWKRLAIELMQEHPNAYASDILDSLPSVERKP